MFHSKYSCPLIIRLFSLCDASSDFDLILCSPESLPEWLRDYPVTIIQFLFFLYHNVAELTSVLMSAEVLTALAQTLFPLSHSQTSTPAEEVSYWL